MVSIEEIEADLSIENSPEWIEDQVSNDEISAAEAGFMMGYEEAA